MANKDDTKQSKESDLKQSPEPVKPSPFALPTRHGAGSGALTSVSKKTVLLIAGLIVLIVIGVVLLQALLNDQQENVAEMPANNDENAFIEQRNNDIKQVARKTELSQLKSDISAKTPESGNAEESADPDKQFSLLINAAYKAAQVEDDEAKQFASDALAIAKSGRLSYKIEESSSLLSDLQSIANGDYSVTSSSD